MESDNDTFPTVRLPTLKGQNPSEPRDSQSNRAAKKKHLRIDCLLRVGDFEPVQVRALVDTGAEISLIRQGILPSNWFYRSANPIRIVGPDDRQV